MRASFELYRAFDQDGEDNREALRRNGNLTIPTLAVWGAISNCGRLLEEMMREVADNVTGVQVESAAHWIAEENPSAFMEYLLEFLDPKGQPE
jgi:pimeloyl-ACP methyl ester carboxylesterase